MSVKQRIIASTLVLMMASSSILAGCSTKSPTEQVSGQSQSSQSTQDVLKAVTINFWGGVPGESGPDKVCENFNSTNDQKITVKYTRYVNDESGNTKLDIALMSGEEVDVFTSHGPDRLNKRVTSGATVNLDEYLKSANLDVEKDFGKNFALYKGSFYAIPVTNAADFIWINKNMFDEAGIAIPTSWTFDEYKAIAKKLTKGSGESKIYGTMTVTGWPDMWMKPAYVALGSDSYSSKYLFNLDNEYFKKALQLKYDMEVVDQSQYPSIVQKVSKVTIQDTFFKGKVAMLYAGSWLVRYAKDTKTYPTQFISAFAPLPAWSKDSKVNYNSAGTIDEYVSININSKNKDASWKFIKYYATDGYIPMETGGKVPSYKKADQAAFVTNFLGENPEKIFDVQSLKSVIFSNFNWFVTPLSTARTSVVTMLETESEKCLSGGQTVDQTIAAMKKNAEEIVSKAK